jgi:hypothetical protein
MINDKVRTEYCIEHSNENQAEQGMQARKPLNDDYASKTHQFNVFVLWGTNRKNAALSSRVAFHRHGGRKSRCSLEDPDPSVGRQTSGCFVQ